MESQKEIASTENEQKNEDKPVILPQKEKKQNDLYVNNMLDFPSDNLDRSNSPFIY